MNIRKIVGLEELLRSLSLEEAPDKMRHVIYPWHEYSLKRGQDVCIWHVDANFSYVSLQRLIIETFKAKGHLTSPKLADALILLYTQSPRNPNPLDQLEQFLSAFTEATISQYVVLPSSPSLKLYGPVDESDSAEPKEELIGFFQHGNFRYEPFAGELFERVKYRFKRLRLAKLQEDLEKILGRLAIYRERVPITVLDFAKLGFRGKQADSVVSLMQYYFDDLAAIAFEGFWEEHLASQFLLVASGAQPLDRTFAEALPGTSWLSLFWGVEVLGSNGMISWITEESHLRGTLSLAVHNFGNGIIRALDRLKEEIGQVPTEAHPPPFPSLLKYARLVTRGRELQSKGYVEESFVLLMVAVESLLASKDAISETISRRAGALLAIAKSKRFEECLKSVQVLYEARSRFVHNGAPISSERLTDLQSLCSLIFFAAYRSQIHCAEKSETAWKRQWVRTLDYFSACLDASFPIDPTTIRFSGLRSIIGLPGEALPD